MLHLDACDKDVTMFLWCYQPPVACWGCFLLRRTESLPLSQSLYEARTWGPPCAVCIHQLQDQVCIFPSCWQRFLVTQVRQSHSCWTAHPTTCTWPSSLTSASLLLASIWSTQVWGEMSCLATRHFFPAVTLFPCVHLPSFLSCFWMVEQTNRAASVHGSDTEEELHFHFFLPYAVHPHSYYLGVNMFISQWAVCSWAYLLRAAACRAFPWEFKQWGPNGAIDLLFCSIRCKAN